MRYKLASIGNATKKNAFYSLWMQLLYQNHSQVPLKKKSNSVTSSAPEASSCCSAHKTWSMATTGPDGTVPSAL